MKKIPLVLIFSRLLLGFILIACSVEKLPHYTFIAVAVLVTGLLTDVLDGIIARRLNCSTVYLRRLDSGIDQLFILSVCIATYIQCPFFFKLNAEKLIILFSSEIVIYLISFIKFKKEVATHSLGAKVWTLFIVATLLEIMLSCNSMVLFNLCFWIGLITRFEIMLILIALKKWTNDVPTFFHALKLRRGIEIKRHRLLNG